MTVRVRGATLLAATTLACLSAVPAQAQLAPLRLASVGGQEQADFASQPALSADGRYVAFQGSLGGVAGVFRKDLASGAVALVAGGDAYDGGPSADARSPSISADGRYVSFVTRAALDPAADTGLGTDVYVRDMAQPIPAPPASPVCTTVGPCPYELASARDGSPAGLTYTSVLGAFAAPRAALSADGRRVAFVTAADSDLGAATPGVPTTPAGQVAVRDLDVDRTTLVSSTRDPATGAMTGRPVPGGAAMATTGPAVPAGAALSADGTTVAWLGRHLPAQVPLLADEGPQIAQVEIGGVAYDEPLWRRIADGPDAPTRRMVGGGDPLAPGCPPGGTFQDAPCRGPFRLPGADSVPGFDSDVAAGWLTMPADGLPQLSADGRIAALVGSPSGVSNAFVVDMRAGLARRDAVRQLTREAPLRVPTDALLPENVQASGYVFDAGISPDGTRAAFTTARSRFPLAPPNLVGTPLGQLGLVELYRVDLPAEALERITGGPGAAPSLGADGLTALNGDGASVPSFSADGRVLAFASNAANLVGGDANGASDAFVAADVAFDPVPGTVEISPAPPLPAPSRLWRMAVTARSTPDGRVRITAVVPGAGTLRAGASARVARPATRAAGSRRLVRRRVGAARVRAHGDGLVSAVLTPARRYRPLARRRHGLEATLRVSFSGRGGRRLADALDVTFRVRPRHGRASR